MLDKLWSIVVLFESNKRNQYIFISAISLIIILMKVFGVGPLANSFLYLWLFIVVFYGYHWYKKETDIGIILVYSIFSLISLYPLYLITESAFLASIMALVLPTAVIIVLMLLNKEAWVGGVDPSVFEDCDDIEDQSEIKNEKEI